MDQLVDEIYPKTSSDMGRMYSQLASMSTPIKQGRLSPSSGHSSTAKSLPQSFPLLAPSSRFISPHNEKLSRAPTYINPRILGKSLWLHSAQSPRDSMDQNGSNIFSCQEAPGGLGMKHSFRFVEPCIFLVTGAVPERWRLELPT